MSHDEVRPKVREKSYQRKCAASQTQANKS